MSQIRLNKTPEFEEVLEYLKSKYRVLSDAEIIKVAVAEKYKKEIGDIPFVDEESEKRIGQSLSDIKEGRYTIVKNTEELEAHLNNLG